MPKEKTITELYDFMQKYLVTKDDIKNMATKDDIKNMATKDDVLGSEKKLRKEMGIMKIELKDYIDEKLSDLQGNIVVLMRKEDHKVLGLIKILREKNILADSEVKKLLQMDPFPKTSL